MKRSILSTLALLLVSVSARVGDGGRQLELSQIQHRKLRRASEDQRIEGQFIIVLSDAVDNILQYAFQLINGSGAEIKYEYEVVLKGFVVDKVVADVLMTILDDSMVKHVSEDAVVKEDSIVMKEFDPPSWGLDKLDGSMDSKYEYSLTGKGVEIYVLDTGVNPNHKEFEGRVYCGYSAVYGEDCTDVRGHGSHVSGTAAGTTYGVAKDASIVAVKVLAKDGTGSESGVINGIEYVAKKKLGNKNQPMVANMSLGGAASDDINAAVAAAIDIGVVFVVSAGNDGGFACDKSPASTDAAITVAAIDPYNNRPYYSNYGSCVDIFGPGSDIVSAWWSSSSAIKEMSGTSMATPHAAGVAALYLEQNPSMKPSQVKAAMLSDGISGAVIGPGDGTPNILLSTQNLVDTDNSAVDIGSKPSAAPSASPSPPPIEAAEKTGTPPPTEASFAAPPPTAAPFAAPTRSPTDPAPAPKEKCIKMFKGCEADSECCTGSCWGETFQIGFCGVKFS